MNAQDFIAKVKANPGVWDMPPVVPKRATWHDRLRCWLIEKLIGDRMVIMNVRIAWKPRLAHHIDIVIHNCEPGKTGILAANSFSCDATHCLWITNVKDTR